MPGAYTPLEKAQARWVGHILLMEDEHIPKFLLCGELIEGRHQVGQPQLRFKDSLKVTRKSLEISIETWETLASDQSTWCSLINQGAKSAEQCHKAAAESKRAAQKARAASFSFQPPASSRCATCGRQFCAWIGHISHLRRHAANQQLKKSWSSLRVMDKHYYYIIIN